MLATVEYAAPVLVVVAAAGEALVMIAPVEPAVGEVGVVRALVIVIPEAEETGEAETEGERDKDGGEDREEGTEEGAEEDTETELEATPPV